MHRRAFLAVLLLSFSGCESPTLPAEGGSGDGGPCTSDEECSDGDFCDGPEVCLSGVCLETVGPCIEGQRCDETLGRCLTECAIRPDADDDGFDARECGGADCDDSDARRSPGAPEVCETGELDEDCDPATFGVRDADGDGSPDARCCNVQSDGTLLCGDDCDDTRSVVHPGNTEACDSFDNDCDTAVDEGVSFTCWIDLDDDSFAPADAVAMSACGCPAGTTTRMPEVGATDCDDHDEDASPNDAEICDPAMLDEDCDGVANPPELCACADGATRSCAAAGRCGSGTETCLTGTWSVCTIQPQDEICNMEDDDCDGRTDEGTTVTCAPDGDGDTYPSALGAPIEACSCPMGTTRTAVGPGTTDCDDTRMDVSPVAPEVCDAGRVDENCDGTANPTSECSCTNGMTRSCTAPGACGTGTQTCAGGTWGACSVGAGTEVCNGVDDDCDGRTDEGRLVVCYTDFDGDGYARSATTTMACTCGSGFTANNPATTGTDCSDTNSSIHPGATELCDRIDSNCSSGGGTATNEDADNDGYAGVSASCTGGFPRTDCNESSPTIHPGATEVCDRIDQDCSGAASATAEDADNDGYSPSTAACTGGFPRTDCNDTNAAIRPGATEACDGIDSNCSGSAADEDADGDRFAPFTATCTGGSYPRTDCDDTRASIAPCAAGCTGIYNAPHTYAVCTTLATWMSAMAVCNGMSMDLVTINSATENSWVRARLSTTTYPNLFIGGTDTVVEGTWRWPSGTQFWMGGAGGTGTGYTNWLSGQPNNDGNQDFLGMDDLGRWADFDNDAGSGGVGRAYVCESR